MLYGLVDNEKVLATPKTKAICLFCNGNLISRCGAVKVWHWAHTKTDNCDSWYEPETKWHYHWKMSFGKENTERIITKENEKHHS